MAPLLKNLLGSSAKDREQTDATRALLAELQQERSRSEELLANVRASAEALRTLGEPIARAESGIDDVGTRLAGLEHRFAAMAQLLPRLEGMDERLEGLIAGQHRAEAQVVQALEESRRIGASFEDIGAKVQQAMELKDHIEKFLELEKPFEHVRDEVVSLRGQVEGTGEQLTKLRGQHERMLDAHKLSATKMEALDRRREDLSRDLQDKERRVAGVAQAVRGLDGIQGTVDDLKRQIATLKALGEFVSQKSAALAAQREAVESALARADSLERAMHQLDDGIRQQGENATVLAALQDDVARLQKLHETVVERSREIAAQQRQTDEQTTAMRTEMANAQDEVKKSVERFDFESRGLESVSQRVTDVRAALADFEARFRDLSQSSLSVAALQSQLQNLSAHVQALSADVQGIDAEAGKLPELRRELAELDRVAHEAGEKVARIEAAQPVVDEALADFGSLRGAHELVRDALEQAQVAHGEIARMRAGQSEVQAWLGSVEQSVEALRAQAEELQELQPLVDSAQRQTKLIVESMDVVRSRQEFVEDLQRRLTALATLGGNLEERDRDLLARMTAAEQRFTGLSGQAEEAERTARLVAETAAGLVAARRDAEVAVGKVAAIQARCESVESLAQSTQALKHELDQRHHSLQAAKHELQRSSKLRQEAAASAQQLDELAGRLTGALEAAEERVTQLRGLATALERRSSDLQPVEHRLDQFEERMAKWSLVEQHVSGALEQLSARQGTVNALQADLDRMFAMAEKTAIEVREITSAQRAVEDSRKLLDTVMSRLQEVRDVASALDERKRQMGKAEERLARTEALLVDVGSSLEALQGQKVIVDQAVEKAGSLQVLVKQAEALAASLREEREMLGRVRTAVGINRDDEADESDEDDEPMAKAA